MTNKYEELKEIQTIQYKILQEVNRICQKHSISYFLCYGTLLGAVRHKASIPWDYDIDIAMPRSEMMRFLQYENELSSELKLEYICYSAIEVSGLVRVIRQNVGKYGNVHIDMFILDFAKKRNRKLNKIVGMWCSFLHMAKLSENEKSILEKHFEGEKRKKIIVKLSRVANKIFGGSERIENWIYRIMVSDIPTKEYVILEDVRKNLEKEYFDEKVMLYYENGKFPCPKGYKELLTMWYGDYMQYPEEGKKYLEYLKEKEKKEDNEK